MLNMAGAASTMAFCTDSTCQSAQPKAACTARTPPTKTPRPSPPSSSFAMQASNGTSPTVREAAVGPCSDTKAGIGSEASGRDIRMKALCDLASGRSSGTPARTPRKDIIKCE